MKLLNKFWHSRLMWWSHKNTFKIQFDVHVECNSVKLKKITSLTFKLIHRFAKL